MEQWIMGVCMQGNGINDAFKLGRRAIVSYPQALS
jgi:hypothetical protein